MYLDVILSNPFVGVILVHDLTNRKSQLNLRRWLTEVLLREGSGAKARTPLVEDFDAEQFGGFSQVYGVKKVDIPYTSHFKALTTTPGSLGLCTVCHHRVS